MKLCDTFHMTSLIITMPSVTHSRHPAALDDVICDVTQVFSPTEDVTNATALHLVFCQIINDVFNPACIRISHAEREAAKQVTSGSAGADGYGLWRSIFSC